jgi:hypothetical protein
MCLACVGCEFNPQIQKKREENTTVNAYKSMENLDILDTGKDRRSKVSTSNS